jgi:hypothetical protein
MKHINIMLSATMDIIVLQILVSLLIIILTYIKVIEWTNKQQTSLQFQVGKWMKISNYPQNMTCYNT